METTGTRLGECKPGDAIRFLDGEVGEVVKQDRDNFEIFTVVRCPSRRKRSEADRKYYSFSAAEIVERAE